MAKLEMIGCFGLTEPNAGSIQISFSIQHNLSFLHFHFPMNNIQENFMSKTIYNEKKKFMEQKQRERERENFYLYISRVTEFCIKKFVG
jgi:hypothetical protein